MKVENINTYIVPINRDQRIFKHDPSKYHVILQINGNPESSAGAIVDVYISLYLNLNNTITEHIYSGHLHSLYLEEIQEAIQSELSKYDYNAMRKLVLKGTSLSTNQQDLDYKSDYEKMKINLETVLNNLQSSIIIRYIDFKDTKRGLKLVVRNDIETSEGGVIYIYTDLANESLEGFNREPLMYREPVINTSLSEIENAIKMHLNSLTKKQLNDYETFSLTLTKSLEPYKIKDWAIHMLKSGRAP